MYCPVCLNDTLKIASSGVVKLTFNGKAKSTSQFFYNLKEEAPIKLNKKLREVIQDYFTYYSEFQNKEIIKEVFAFSSDFKCSNGCAVTLDKKFNILNLVIDRDDFLDTLENEAESYGLELDLNKIKSANRV